MAARSAEEGRVGQRMNRPSCPEIRAVSGPRCPAQTGRGAPEGARCGRAENRRTSLDLRPTRTSVNERREPVSEPGAGGILLTRAEEDLRGRGRRSSNPSGRRRWSSPASSARTWIPPELRIRLAAELPRVRWLAFTLPAGGWPRSRSSRGDPLPPRAPGGGGRPPPPRKPRGAAFGRADLVSPRQVPLRVPRRRSRDRTLGTERPGCSRRWRKKRGCGARTHPSVRRPYLYPAGRVPHAAGAGAAAPAAGVVPLARTRCFLASPSAVYRLRQSGVVGYRAPKSSTIGPSHHGGGTRRRARSDRGGPPAGVARVIGGDEMRDLTITMPGRVRPRRLRRTGAIRRSGGGDPHFSPPRFVLPPLRACPPTTAEEPVPSMPGISLMGVDTLLRRVEADLGLGIRSVLLFGHPVKGTKSPGGEAAADPGGGGCRGRRWAASRRRSGGDLVVMTDVCLCGYTDHGHCGLLRRGWRRAAGAWTTTVRFGRSWRRPLSHARAGADVVAPFRHDGRTGGVHPRCARRRGIPPASRCSPYTAKYASAYYGPFRGCGGLRPRRTATGRATRWDCRNRLESAQGGEARRERGRGHAQW